jgi:AcrR family transcriptional regulator
LASIQSAGAAGTHPRRTPAARRIAETGLRLFMTDGYENTTLEAIAEAAGISRRTFFYYFKSKEDIILVWQSNFTHLMRAAVIAEPPHQRPSIL